MTAALIIGSTVCDVMIYWIVCRVVKGIPILITSNGQWEVVPLMSLISFIFLSQSYQFVSPVGSGMYGDFIPERAKTIRDFL